MQEQLKPTHIIIVEDIDSTREMLAAMAMQVFNRVSVVQANCYAQAMQWLAQHSDTDFIALVDVGLPDGSGVDIVRRIATEHPRGRAVIITLYDDDEVMFSALAAGAEGYLLKSDEQEAIAAALKGIMQGAPPVSPALVRRIMAYFRQPSMPVTHDKSGLTKREEEVLTLLGLGMRVSEAANELTLSEHTVRDHVKSIYRKLNIACRAEAAVEAVRRGLV